MVGERERGKKGARITEEGRRRGVSYVGKGKVDPLLMREGRSLRRRRCRKSGKNSDSEESDSENSDI